MLVKISDLRAREIVNIVDGRRLGVLKDIEVNLEEGRISALILPGVQGRILSFWGREDEVVIPWERIKKIGVDVILVELTGFSEYQEDSRGLGW